MNNNEEMWLPLITLCYRENDFDIAEIFIFFWPENYFLPFCSCHFSVAQISVVTLIDFFNAIVTTRGGAKGGGMGGHPHCVWKI